ncbi:MAG: lipoyl synthase [Lentisphaerae bacterium]|jgi:lipoyl synthase|nr:lipoyl synthase [Lentisphaerota bacterium]MBT4818341.1 lipoyl synthase [Lentisphaerota bacterium]MBT5610704.1 lipoyl synthase [Lentisphaerota bacterium]MBT7054273.1 lipoyl synthase [Lentisphaerota bacterium]MBT7844334.1 lipoyl synthase [Lentisphaerota bacterium]
MSTPRKRLPEWLRVSYRGGRARQEVKELLKGLRLHTVCESATCPNLCECWGRHTATFMLLGSVCTRDCRFCDVPHGTPPPPDGKEPENVAEAAERLALRYVVLTCVTRDDLVDGGAGHFAATVNAIRARAPETQIEVLTSDFGGREEDLATVLQARPDVFNHNIETVGRLTPEIRSHASYRRSLTVLANATRLGQAHNIAVKSGFMLGLGETDDEIRTLLGDLREAGVSILTIGQYLPPSANHWPLARYAPPEEFDEWARIAKEEVGFSSVVSGPLVRSSYMADQAVEAALHPADNPSDA